MPSSKKKRRKIEAACVHNDEEDEDGDSAALGSQVLPVAELPVGFDGIPLDGAQYLAIVRQEASGRPKIVHVRNPFSTKADEGSVAHVPSPQHQAVMPSKEWRNTFEARMRNMRESLDSFIKLGVPSAAGMDLPRRDDEASWYKLLHGCNLGRDSSRLYSLEEQKKRQDDQNMLIPKTRVPTTFALREPTATFLSRLQTGDILALLKMFPAWFSSNPSDPLYSNASQMTRCAVDPFHARWVFTLLARLDNRLLGDQVNTLRVLARAGIERIVQERCRRAVICTLRRERQPQVPGGPGGEGSRGDHLDQEMGAWMIVTAVSSIWGQHDLWDDAHTDLARIHPG